MQIEVTEKEAMGIYSERHYDKLGKKRYIPPAIFAIALFAGLMVMYYVNDWMGVGVFVLLSIPSVFMTLKSARTSGQYAKKLIEEQK